MFAILVVPVIIGAFIYAAVDFFREFTWTVGSIQADKKYARQKQYEKDLGSIDNGLGISERETKIDELVSDFEKNKEEIYGILEEDLTEIFGEDFRDKFPVYPKRSGRFRINITTPWGSNAYEHEAYIDDRYWAKQLLLSKEGKMGRYEIDQGIRFGSGRDKNFDKKMAIARRIQYNLRKYHPWVTLCFDFGNGKYIGSLDSLLIEDARPRMFPCDFEHGVCLGYGNLHYPVIK